MSADLDRFDRMLLATVRRAPSPSPVEREPVISSKRGPRFVDYTPCPLCTSPRVGVEFHGELMNGDKVHELAKHTVGSSANIKGQPTCMASKMRLAFVDGSWRGAAS